MQAGHVPVGSYIIYLPLAGYFHFVVEYHLSSFGKVEQPGQETKPVTRKSSSTLSAATSSVCSILLAPLVPQVTLSWTLVAFDY